MLTKFIVAQGLDEGAARALIGRWAVLATGLSPGSVALARHIESVWLAVQQLREQQAAAKALTFTPPPAPRYDEASEVLDEQVRDYMDSHPGVSYSAAPDAVVARPEHRELLKRYVQR